MIVEVKMYDQSLGSLEWNPQKGTSTFQYDRNWIRGGVEPSPLMLPLRERIFETNRDHRNFHNLPYLLSDSMPDDFGNRMMKEWLRQKNHSFSDINPVERLTYIGKRGMGALEYHPIRHKEETDYDVSISELIDIAKNVLHGKEKTTFGALDKQTISEILRIGTSVGGARAKALISMKRDERNRILEIKPGDVLQPEGYSYWILKIDGVEDGLLDQSSGLGKVEFGYYLMAKKAGIDISESFLHEENNRFHFATRRFDRTEKGERIHMQSYGALAGIDFRIPRAGSYENLFRLMKILQLPYTQFEQQYRRMIFNVVARNQDDHVKNFSFLMDRDGTWRISPAYDLSFQYKQGGMWTNDHQTSINGKFNDFNRADLLNFAENFGIKRAGRIIDDMIDVVAQWPKLASELDIPKVTVDRIHSALRINEF